MKNTLCLGFFALLLSLTFSACRDNHRYCTEEYRQITVRVNGLALDEYYTIRLSTGDTIRTYANTHWDNYYVILSDQYQTQLRNRRDSFRFVGLVAGQIRVDETFVIEADHCHINKISGKEEVVF